MTFCTRSIATATPEVQNVVRYSNHKRTRSVSDIQRESFRSALIYRFPQSNGDRNENVQDERGAHQRLKGFRRQDLILHVSDIHDHEGQLGTTNMPKPIITLLRQSILDV